MLKNLMGQYLTRMVLNMQGIDPADTAAVEKATNRIVEEAKAPDHPLYVAAVKDAESILKGLKCFGTAGQYHGKALMFVRGWFSLGSDGNKTISLSTEHGGMVKIQLGVGAKANVRLHMVEEDGHVGDALYIAKPTLLKLSHAIGTDNPKGSLDLIATLMGMASASTKARAVPYVALVELASDVTEVKPGTKDYNLFSGWDLQEVSAITVWSEKVVPTIARDAGIKTAKSFVEYEPSRVKNAAKAGADASDSVVDTPVDADADLI